MLKNKELNDEKLNRKTISELTFTKIEFDKYNLFFKSDPYKINFDRVKIKNTGTTCIYYKWQKLISHFKLPDKKGDGIDRFFCHYADSKLFPDEEREFVFSFFSEKSGMFSEDWILVTSPPIKNANLIIHLNGMCLHIEDNYSEHIYNLEQNLAANAAVTFIKEYILDLISTIKEDEPLLPDMEDISVFKFYFNLNNRDYNVEFSIFAMEQFKKLHQEILVNLEIEENKFWNGSIKSLKSEIANIPIEETRETLFYKLECLIHATRKVPPNDSMVYPYFKSIVSSLALEFNDISNTIREECNFHPIIFDLYTKQSFVTEKELNAYKNDLNKKRDDFYKKNRKKPLKPDEEERELNECKLKIFETLSHKLVEKFTKCESDKIQYILESTVLNSNLFDDEYVDRISRVKSVRSIKNEALDNKVVIVRVDIDEYNPIYEDIVDEENEIVGRKIKEIEFPNAKDLLLSVNFFLNNQVRAVLLLVDFGPKFGTYKDDFSTKFLFDYIYKNSLTEQKVNFIENSELPELYEKLNSDDFRETELFIIENINFNQEECGFEIENDPVLTTVPGDIVNLKYNNKIKYVDMLSMRDPEYPKLFLDNQIFILDSCHSICEKFPSVVDMQTKIRAIGLRVESPVQKITTLFQIESEENMLIIGDDEEIGEMTENYLMKKLLIINSLLQRFKVIFIMGKLALFFIHFIQNETVLNPKYKFNHVMYRLIKYIFVRAELNHIEIILPVDGKIMKKSEYQKYDPTYYENVIDTFGDNDSADGDGFEENFLEEGEEKKEKSIPRFKSPELYSKYIKILFKKEKKLKEVYQLFNIDSIKNEEGEENQVEELYENEEYKENKLRNNELDLLDLYKEKSIQFNFKGCIREFVKRQNIQKPRKKFKTELEMRKFNEYIYTKELEMHDIDDIPDLTYAENSQNENLKNKLAFNYDEYELVDYGENTYNMLVTYIGQMNCLMWLGKLSPSLIENMDDPYAKIVENIFKRKSTLKQQFKDMNSETEKKLHESDLKAKKYLMSFLLKSTISYQLVKKHLLVYLQPPEDKESEIPQDEETFNSELTNLIDYYISEKFEYVDRFLAGEHIPGLYGLMEDEKKEKEPELDLKFLEEI